MNTKFLLAFDAGAKGTRYIDNENSKFGTSDRDSAKQFDSELEAIEFKESNSLLCWIEKIEEDVLTYDIHYDNDTSSNNEGFKETLEYCEKYIKIHNGSNHSYFQDYKGGTVSIVCSETDLTVFETEII